MLLLSESAVMGALSMADAIHVNAQAFLAVSATAQTQVPDYAAIHTHAAQQSQSQSESDSQSHQQQPSVPADATLFKPALLDEALGIKVVAIRPVRKQRSAECGCAAWSCGKIKIVFSCFCCCSSFFLLSHALLPHAGQRAAISSDRSRGDPAARPRDWLSDCAGAGHSPDGAAHGGRQRSGH
jgi:hypothetical protein